MPKFDIGAYTEFPLTNGVNVTVPLSNGYFVETRYGVAPEYYMQSMGDILENFDWWDSLYTDLIKELLTGMSGYSISFGKRDVLGHKGWYALFGGSYYVLDYNSLTNELLNDLFDIGLPDFGRDIKAVGKLTAFKLQVGKQFQVSERFNVDASVAINRIFSVYVIGESESILNNTVSYELSQWLRDNLEGLTLPTATLAVNYQF